MPFIETARRAELGQTIKVDDWTPGDWCYTYYKTFLREWRINPRWETVQRLKEFYLKFRRQLKKDIFATAAFDLAWEVFFAREVMPYEAAKVAANGDISNEELGLDLDGKPL